MTRSEIRGLVGPALLRAVFEWHDRGWPNASDLQRRPYPAYGADPVCRSCSLDLSKGWDTSLDSLLGPDGPLTAWLNARPGRWYHITREGAFLEWAPPGSLTGKPVKDVGEIRVFHDGTLRGTAEAVCVALLLTTATDD